MSVCSRRKQKSLLLRIYQHRYLYLLLSFGLIYFIVFRYIPMYGVQLAFKKFSYRKGVVGSPWVGWNNFKTLFMSAPFKRQYADHQLWQDPVYVFHPDYYGYTAQ